HPATSTVCRPARAQRSVGTRPNRTVAAPHPARTAQATWLAGRNPARPPATIEPHTATPIAPPVARQVDAIAPATPASSRGSPARAVLVIGVLTSPEPAPNST